MKALTVSGSFGRAENRTSGRVRRTATNTDKADRILNERVLGVFTVVTA